MLVMLSGMVRDVRDVHKRKASSPMGDPSPMEVTLSGMVKWPEKL